MHLFIHWVLKFSKFHTDILDLKKKEKIVCAYRYDEYLANRNTHFDVFVRINS